VAALAFHARSKLSESVQKEMKELGAAQDESKSPPVEANLFFPKPSALREPACFS